MRVTIAVPTATCHTVRIRPFTVPPVFSVPSVPPVLTFFLFSHFFLFSPVEWVEQRKWGSYIMRTVRTGRTVRMCRTGRTGRIGGTEGTQDTGGNGYVQYGVYIHCGMHRYCCISYTYVEGEGQKLLYLCI